MRARSDRTKSRSICSGGAFPKKSVMERNSWPSTSRLSFQLPLFEAAHFVLANPHSAYAGKQSAGDLATVNLVPAKPHVDMTVSSPGVCRVRIACRARDGAFLAVVPDKHQRSLFMMDGDMVHRLAAAGQPTPADWIIRPADGIFSVIEHEATGKFLDVDKGCKDNGALAVVCTESAEHSPHWHLASPDGFGSNLQRYSIKARHSGKALDLGLGETHDVIQQWDHHGLDNQTWIILSM
ncbi:hypothetical protein BC831DRAFT_456502 [Entophlyctis helioformis]|nr:hypothetical protein BC831DRAFT_456502 [Entophlyctis helioformis]